MKLSEYIAWKSIDAVVMTVQLVLSLLVTVIVAPFILKDFLKQHFKDMRQ